MANVEIYSDGTISKTNSKNVAEVFNKRHFHVMRDIESLDCSANFRASNYGLSNYTSDQNKVLPCVEMTKDGFTFLCMGYKGDKAAQFKEAYIAEFNRMAESLHTISDRVNALELGKLEIKAKGRAWSEIGHEIQREKRVHQEKETKLLNDVQLKISFEF